MSAASEPTGTLQVALAHATRLLEASPALAAEQALEILKVLAESSGRGAAARGGPPARGQSCGRNRSARAAAAHAGRRRRPRGSSTATHWAAPGAATRRSAHSRRPCRCSPTTRRHGACSPITCWRSATTQAAMPLTRATSSVRRGIRTCSRRRRRWSGTTFPRAEALLKRHLKQRRPTCRRFACWRRSRRAAGATRMR